MGQVETSELKGNFIARFARLAMQFWSGPTRRIAWLLSLGFVACLLANMLMAVAVNRWNKYFFDALQLKNLDQLQWSIVLVVVLSLGSGLAYVALTQMRMRLQLRWRGWLTATLISRW